MTLYTEKMRSMKVKELDITKKEWIIAWIEKKLGIISPSAYFHGYMYTYDLYKAWYRKGK